MNIHKVTIIQNNVPVHRIIKFAWKRHGPRLPLVPTLMKAKSETYAIKNN